jgi:peptidoglycan hydrolase CwlO-like protein
VSGLQSINIILTLYNMGENMKRFFEVIETNWKVIISGIFMAFVVVKLIQIDNKLSSINYNLHFITSYTSSIESDISSIKSDISSIDSDISNIESNISSIELEVSSLESSNHY